MKILQVIGVTLVPLFLLVVSSVSLNGQGSLPVVGSAAPAVSGKDQDGHVWKLSDLKGQCAVILYFYPKDDTPGCTKEACGFRDQMEAIKSAGVKVIGVSFDSPAQHQEFIKKYGLNFDLLADTDGEIADAFGVRSGNGNMARRVSFLIDKEGVIRHITESPDAQRHLEEMRQAVGALTK